MWCWTYLRGIVEAFASTICGLISAWAVLWPGETSWVGRVKCLFGCCRGTAISQIGQECSWHPAATLAGGWNTPAQQCVGWGTWCLSCPRLHCQDLPGPLCLQAGLKERAPVVGVMEPAATEKVLHILGDQTGWPKRVERVGRCCSDATVTFERSWRSGRSLMAGEVTPIYKNLGL